MPARLREVKEYLAGRNHKTWLARWMACQEAALTPVVEMSEGPQDAPQGGALAVVPSCGRAAA
eukprot:11780245-Alexandrium_andersonii.AAC.1